MGLWEYEKAVHRRAWLLTRTRLGGEVVVVGVAACIGPIAFVPIYALFVGWEAARAEIGPVLLAAAGTAVAAAIMIYAINLVRAPAQIHREQKAEITSLSSEIRQAQRRSADTKRRLTELSARALHLHNDIPHDDATNLVEEWLPRYEQLKDDIVRTLPTNYKTLFRQRVKACEEKARLTEWEEDDWREAVMGMKAVVDEIIPEVGASGSAGQ